jgi:hypothetical protein
MAVAKLTKRQKITKAVKRTAWWWGGNGLYGLAPILLVLPGGFTVSSETQLKAKEAILTLINEGAINFFWLAVVGAITVDVMLARKQFKNDFPVTILIIGILFTIGVAVIYVAYVFAGDEHHSFGNERWMTIIISFFAFCFCTIGKINLFLKEK